MRASVKHYPAAVTSGEHEITKIAFNMLILRAQQPFCRSSYSCYTNKARCGPIDHNTRERANSCGTVEVHVAYSAIMQGINHGGDPQSLEWRDANVIRPPDFDQNIVLIS